MKGVPKKRYEQELKAKDKYPICNYTSTIRGIEGKKDLYGVTIPTNIQEALEHPNWMEAMNEELTTLQKNQT